MKRSLFLLLTLILLLSACGAPAGESPAAAPGSEQFPPCDALFYGDSITAGNNFDEFFPELVVVDKGINGATIEDLTRRVPEVSAHAPAKIFVMAGGNNLESNDPEHIEHCLELYRGLLDALREACPEAEIYVESMLPMDKSIAFGSGISNRTIRTYNKGLQAIAEEYDLPYLDIYPAYERTGGLNPDYTEDGIHLKDDAFGPWAEILRPYLEA
jgi:lysophospholipase L1-like esterase